MQDLHSLMDMVQHWVAANPGLAKSIMEVSAVLGVLLVTLGGVMLAAGAILGPMALLKLSFITLAGEEGIGGAITAIKTFGTDLIGLLPGISSASLSIKGWAGVFKKITTGAKVAASSVKGFGKSISQAIARVATSPFETIKTLFGGIKSIVASSFSGLVSGLGSALSMLLSPVGLVVGALIVGAVLVYKYWDQVSAFFSGFATSFIKGIQPVLDAFSPLILALEMVWDWFEKLLSPVQSSTKELGECAAAGASFGQIVANGLNVALFPLRVVADTITWILEKLHLIPDAAKRAADAAREAKLDDKVTTLLSDMGAVTIAGQKQSEQLKGAEGKPKPLGGVNFSSLTGNMPKIANNTAQIAENTKPKGPGAIVFKNTPALQRLRGGWREPVVQQIAQNAGSVWGGIKQAAGALAIATMPYAVAQPAQAAGISPASQSQQAATAGGNVYNITINATPDHSSPQDIAAMVRREIEAIERQKGRAMRSRLRDND